MSLFLFIGCASLSRDREAADLHLRIGIGHLNAGNYPQALAELLESEKLDSSNPIVQNNLGLAYFLRDRLDLSESHLRKALSLKSDYSESRNNLGRVLIERGKYQEAISEITKVINDLTYQNPDKALTNLGLAQFKMGQYDVAKKTFIKAIDHQRENCLALNYYGRCFYELKDYRRAAESLDKAVGFCQRMMFDEPHYYSALSYYQLGQVGRAEARLEELIKLYSDGRYIDKAKSMLETIRR